MILEKSEDILYDNILCDSCLGRQFALLGSGTTNRKRGNSIKFNLVLEGDRILNEEEDTTLLTNLAQFFDFARETLKRREAEEPAIKEEVCDLCNGLMDSLDELACIVNDNLEDLEFNNFLIGSKLKQEIVNKEERIWTEYGINYSESIKSEINREIGKRVESMLSKEVEFQNPEVVAIVNTDTESVEININPIYIYGRYKKLERGLPQTEWFCHVCRGEGCMRCDGSGYLYNESVEQIISKPAIELTKGEESVFHGAGREDIDVRMLGNGRPFIIEIKEPKRRKLNLNELKNLINKKDDEKVKVDNLKIVDKNKVVELKQAEAPKTYMATISGDFDERDVEKIDTSKPINIKQETPSRISRRPEKVRDRSIHQMSVEELEKDSAVVKIKADAGTYMKEFIEGDYGKTKPSLSSILGKEVNCSELDVIQVHYED